MNPFINTLAPIWRSPTCVYLDEEVLNRVAAEIALEDMPIPSWYDPVFPADNNEIFINFIGVGNAINFAFTDFNTHERFSVEYKAKEWRGAFGMWACLLRALDQGVDILKGEFLAGLEKKQCEEIFRGKSQIPMVEERWSILRQVGGILCGKYEGSFFNLFEKSHYNAFGDGGIVDRLLKDFPSFNDQSLHRASGNVLKFHKRAQLLAMMYQGRAWTSTELPKLSDFEDLGPIADYAVPKALHTAGILIYSDTLLGKVRSYKLIEKDSVEEQELRAQTIHAQVKLMEHINKLRASKINFLQLDYKVWGLGRGGSEPHHLTKTTAY